jgi:hypothetical protein
MGIVGQLFTFDYRQKPACRQGIEVYAADGIEFFVYKIQEYPEIEFGISQFAFLKPQAKSVTTIWDRLKRSGMAEKPAQNKHAEAFSIQGTTNALHPLIEAEI